MTDTKDVLIERTFAAPMGAKIAPAAMDVRVGGRRHIAMEMHTPGGAMKMFFVGEYREIDPKTRLVYTESMADADGNPMCRW